MATEPIVTRYRVDPPAPWSDAAREFVGIGILRWEAIPEVAALERNLGPCVADGRTANGLYRELQFWHEGTRTLTVVTYKD